MIKASARRRAPEWLVWAALIVVYVVWGSTYLAIRLVVESMPPLLAAAARHIVAGLIIGGALLALRGPGALRLSRAELRGSAFVGVALLVGGNGLVMLGERDVPSGLAALIIAVVPLCVVVLRLAFGERIRLGTLVGVLVGFAGVAVLVVPRGVTGSVAPIGMLMLLGAAASWAVGTYYSQRVGLPRDPFVATAAQLVLGGLGLAVVGVVAGEVGLLQAAAFSDRSIVAFVYLVTFGSILAYTAYTWLLQNAPVSKVATYAYVNPVVAIVLGWWVLSEEINPSMVIGGAMIIVAVGLVVRTESRPSTPVGALEVEPSRAIADREGQSPDRESSGAESMP